MNLKDRNPDDVLDLAIAAVRDQAIDPGIEGPAATRVWRKLRDSTRKRDSAVSGVDSVESLHALIPAYLAGRLPEAKRILFEDEMRSTASLRKAVESARSGGEKVAFRPRRTGGVFSSPVGKWILMAAMILMVVGLARIGIFDQFLPSSAVGQANVRALEGSLFQVTASGSRVLTQGEPIVWKEGVRTAKNAGTVLELPDGSLVEMNERSELDVNPVHDGITINLRRGSVIVQAAKRSKGRLYVRTADCTVAVKGTVFSVNSGARGSRVSVIEGEVEVEQGRKRQILGPGQQFTSSERLSKVPVASEIAWSKEADRHLELLKAIEAIDEEINQALFPGLRFSSRFLDLVPAGTSIFAAVPNLASGLGEAHRIFLERIEGNAQLKQYWEQSVAKISQGMEPAAIAARLQELGSFLGDEIVVAVSADSRGEIGEPLVMSEVLDSSGLRRALEEEAAGANASERLRIVDDPSSAVDEGEKLYIFLRGDVAAASPSLGALQRFQRDFDGGGSGFVGSSFHARLDDFYRQGVDWLFGADLETLMAGQLDSSEETIARASGLSDLRHLIVELREADGHVENRAMLTFEGRRRGVVSWLDPPAPIGALDFVSSRANFAMAVAVKDPSMMLEDAMEMFGSQRVLADLVRIQEETGVDLRSGLVDALGGEIVVAVDGPILPTPSWKMVMEVYDQESLQQTIEAFVEQVNAHFETQGKPGVELTQETVEGITIHSLKVPEVGLLAQGYYAFHEGYLIAAPSKALVLQSLAFRDLGDTLVRSRQFAELLPQDGQTGFSAVFYQNLKSALEPLVALGRSANMTDEQRQAMDAMADRLGASLVCAYAGDDRILLATTGSFGLSPSSLMGLGSLDLKGLVEGGGLLDLPGIR